MTSLIPAFPEGRIQQLGYVVEDLDESVEKFSAMFGIKRFFVWENLAAEVTGKTYGGRSGDARFSYADTVGDFGVFTELAYGPPEFLASFDRIKSGDF
ncbi:hypothetical protein [Streptomyces sp. SAI-129]|uniref:hypothetical protein n=1 Tax=Streptomyces sp. SAI-129 TaxID=3377727 RepID=UPI003C7A86B5